MLIYNTTISTGSLMLPESRRIAVLLLEKPTKERWIHVVRDENILQKNPVTVLHQARFIRNRLETLNTESWQLIADSVNEIAIQLLLAAAIKHSRLLADFMCEVYAQNLQQIRTALNRNQWESFLADCIHRDDHVERWSTSTRKKIFQVIVRILTEAKYLDTTRQMNPTPPMLHPVVTSYLKRNGDTQTLSLMEYSR